MRNLYDVCVIGGGPAGMIAAGRAAECGASVVLLERNRGTGRKLLLTGGGRCNVTNAEPDRHRLVGRYGANSAALHSPFSRFSPQDMRSFLERFGVETHVEDEGRVFPSTNQARSILSALRQYMEQGGVEILTGSNVRRIVLESDCVLAEFSPDHGSGGHPRNDGGATDADSTTRSAAACVLATGGTSRPETGSTGDGFRWLTQTGHSVRTPQPSLVPVRTRDTWPHALQGLSLSEVKLTAVLDGVRQFDGTGKLVFTHFGISGPLVLNLAQQINQLAQGGPVDLSLDLFPSEDGGAVDRKIVAAMAATPNRKVRNVLGTIVPDRMAAIVLEQTGVNGDLPCNSVPRDARRVLGSCLKALIMRFEALLGSDHAVVSSGGVSPLEVDFRTMQSKRHPRLFVTGDLLDFERRSGGYSLQLCWSTGYVAGEAAAALARA